MKDIISTPQYIFDQEWKASLDKQALISPPETKLKEFLHVQNHGINLNDNILDPASRRKSRNVLLHSPPNSMLNRVAHSVFTEPMKPKRKLVLAKFEEDLHTSMVLKGSSQFNVNESGTRTPRANLINRLYLGPDK